MDVDQKPSDANVRRKGRGFRATDEGRSDAIDSKNATFDRLDDKPSAAQAGVAARSIEGWIVFVGGVHEEATEEDIHDRFAEYGEIKNMHLNLDRRTGYVKGYALVEYETKREAEAAIKGTNGTQLLDQTVHSDFAFVKAPNAGKGDGTGGRGQRRSVSPKGRPPLVNRID